MPVSLLVGCENDNKKDLPRINMNVTHHVYQLNTDDMSIVGGEKTGTDKNQVKCGLRYKITFDVGIFKDDAKKLPENGTDVTVTVKMGDFENDDNIKNITTTKGEAGGGVHLEYKQRGLYKGSLNLANNSYNIDFTSTFLIVGVDSLVGTSGGQVNNQVSVSFESTEYNFFVKNSRSYSLDLIPVKGDYQFNKDNIVDLVGVSYYKHDQNIVFPKGCKTVKVELFDDESMSKTYGYKEFARLEYGDTSKINLATIAKEFLGTAKYEEMEADGGFDLYIKYTAVGGTNYNDASIVIKHNF